MIKQRFLVQEEFKETWHILIFTVTALVMHQAQKVLKLFGPIISKLKLHNVK
jgi:hypothetical protein